MDKMMCTEDFIKEIYKDKLNESALGRDLKRVETLSPSLNWALNGGLVRGRFYVLIGPEGSGKTMVCNTMIYSLTKDNPKGVTIWFDAERSWTNHWIKVLFRGPDFELHKNIIIRPTQDPEQIFDYFANDLMDMVDRGLSINACVIDSMQQIIGPKEENKKSTTDAVMGDLGSYLPGAIRKIVDPARDKEVPWFFISQVRGKFDNAQQKYVSKEDKYSMSGGYAFKHGVDVVILLEQAKGKSNAIFNESVKNIDEKPLKVGHLIRAFIIKNRLGPCYRKSEFMFQYSSGIVQTNIELCKLAINLGFVQQSGRSYSLVGNEVPIATSASELLSKFENDETIRSQVLGKIRATYDEVTEVELQSDKLRVSEQVLESVKEEGLEDNNEEE